VTSSQIIESTRAPAERSLWRNPDFVKLWSGESASMLGSAVSYIAFPLVGTLTLHANALQMGVLAMAGRLPQTLFGVVSGALVDRLPLRALMLVSDYARALLLAWVPVGAALGLLRIEQLYVIAFLVAAFTFVFNVAYQALIPHLIDDPRLPEANGKLSASQSASEVAGPGVATALAYAGGIPSAIAADVASYLVSAFALTRISKTWPGRAHAGDRSIKADVLSGFRLLWADPVLRWGTISIAIVTCFCQMQLAIYFLFLTSQLRMSMGVIGLVFSASAVIGFCTAVSSGKLVARFGIGPSVATALMVESVGGLLLALAGGGRISSALIILASETCFAVGSSVFMAGFTSIRQVRAAAADRGKIIGTSRFITCALVPLFSLAGGIIGSAISLRGALLTGAFGMIAGSLLMFRRDILTVSFPARDHRSDNGR
jgi:hypothetical protein